MGEKPILMSWAMVRATLREERPKTQTRRVITPQPAHVWGWGVSHQDPEHFAAHVRYPGGRPPDPWVRCPYGKPGDRLWVRETWAYHFGKLMYRADCHPDSFHYDAKGWKPSIHMPRRLSRITLEITALRVERVKSISEADAEAEGVEPGPCVDGLTYRCGFSMLWDGINARRGHGWAANPWVWVVEFRRARP